MGVYVKPVSRLTGAYMALIDPFRRWIVYPALIRRFEAMWADGNPPGNSERTTLSPDGR